VSSLPVHAHRSPAGGLPHPVDRNALHITALCLNGCGTLAEGTTADAPGGRHETRWAEIEAGAEKHTKQPGHAVAVTTVPPEVTG
jgi:hypothetical protein